MHTMSIFMFALLNLSAFAAGLDAGSKLPGYNPKHLTGPDKGSKECPS
ncbi:MAG TPA: hypothetical protein VEK08_02370 [Planctomycetota bacterium]|nr:hypothetical protein [Planctomycetota bacterium]